MEKPILVIPGLNPEVIAVLYNTKKLDQYRHSVEKLLRGECPFCQIDWTINKLLFETERWYAWHSAFPQDDQDVHIVIPHKKHIGHLRDLGPEDYGDLEKIMSKITGDKSIELPGGGMSLRFGDPRLHAGSVPGHLHWNIQVPNGKGRVQVTLCKTPEEIAEKTRMLVVFEKLRQGATVDQLTEEESKLVKGRI